MSFVLRRETIRLLTYRDFVAMICVWNPLFLHELQSKKEFTGKRGPLLNGLADSLVDHAMTIVSAWS